jgi:hypothetical protein
VFGCAAYTWLPQVHRELGKLNARAELTVFLGFEEGTSNSLLVDRNNGRFLRARDVRFVEDRFLQKVTKFQPLTSSMFSGRESKKQNIKEVNRQQSQWEQEKSKNRSTSSFLSNQLLQKFTSIYHLLSIVIYQDQLHHNLTHPLLTIHEHELMHNAQEQQSCACNEIKDSSKPPSSTNSLL